MQAATECFVASIGSTRDFIVAVQQVERVAAAALTRLADSARVAVVASAFVGGVLAAAGWIADIVGARVAVGAVLHGAALAATGVALFAYGTHIAVVAGADDRG